MNITTGNTEIPKETTHNTKRGNIKIEAQTITLEIVTQNIHIEAHVTTLNTHIENRTDTEIHIPPREIEVEATKERLKIIVNLYSHK